MDFNKKIDELVQRSEIADEMLAKGVKDTAQLSEALSMEIDGGLELSLSEDQLSGMVDNAPMIAQLAGAMPDAANPSPIGNYTFGTLNMLIQEWGSTLTKDFSLSTMFPDIMVPEYKVMVERVTRVAGLINDWSINAEFPAVRPLDTYGYEFEPAFHAGEIKLGAQEIFFARKKGGGNFKDRGLRQMIAMNSVNLMGKINTKKKMNLIDAVMGNGFSYLGTNFGSGVGAAQVYNIDTSKVGTNAWWSQNSVGRVTTYNANAFPLQDLANMISSWQSLLMYRHALKAIIFAYQDLVNLLNHPNVWTLKNYLAMSHEGSFFQSLGDKILEYSLPSHPEVKLVADKDIFVPESLDGTARTANGIAQANDPFPLSPVVNPQSLFPTGIAMMAVDVSENGGRLGAYHLTINPASRNLERPEMGYSMQVVPELDNPRSAPSISLIGSLSGAPAIYMPEAIFLLSGYINFV